MAFLPLSAVHGSSGTVDLGTVDSNTAPSAYTAAVNFVNVTAGSDIAKNDCVVINTCNTAFLAINFNGVVFSGSQFQLYLSTNGFSQINFTHGQTQDFLYGPTFNVAALSTAYASVGGGYHIGTVAGVKVVEGPIPTAISNAYKFIKIFDGSSTSVAASLKQIGILPGISVLPTSGAAGASIAISGGGFPRNIVVDILYSFTTFEWTTDAPVASSLANLTTGVSTGQGYFTVTTAAPDTKESVNTLVSTHGNIPVGLQAKLEKAPHTLYATATYNETPRFITEVKSLDNTGNCISATHSCGVPYVATIAYGNDTGHVGAITLNGNSVTLTAYPTLDAKVKGSLIIAGNDSYVNSAVTFWVGSTQIGSATSTATGLFNGTATIPILPSGPTTIYIKNNGVVYNFGIVILPTLILTPHSGPVGTVVSASAYGFPSNKYVSLWWNEHTLGDGSDYYLINGTVDSTGSYNVTMTFTVPHAYGGDHDVDATYTKITTGATQPDYIITESAGYVTSGTFTITPTIVLNVTTVNSNSKQWIEALGTGFNPDLAYNLNLDNAQYSPATAWTTCSYYDEYECYYPVPGSMVPAQNGDLNVTFSATGFRPGLHIASFYSADSWSEYYNYDSFMPAVYAYFNVTTTGDYISTQITGFTASINSLKSTVTTLSGQISTLSTSVSGIATNVETIITNTNGLSTAISALGTKIDALNTALGTTGSSVTSISSKLDTITSTVNSIQSSLSSSGNIGTAISGMQDQVKSTQDAVSSASTYVLVVAVLAAITLVLELAILVRKLS